MASEIIERVFLRVAGEGRRAIWMIHAPGDSGRSFEPLLTTSLLGEFTILIPDLPGFGVSSPRPGSDSLSGVAETVSELIERRTPDTSFAVVGHSLGASVASLTADLLRKRCGAVVSIEGNLTAADAYFTGRAALFEESELFKRDLCEVVWQRAAAETPEANSMRRYLASLMFADAETLWRIGRDAHAASHNDGLGAAFRSLSCPKLYCWSPRSTLEETRRYIQRFGIPNHMFAETGHWPMVDAPLEAAKVIGDFLNSVMP